MADTYFPILNPIRLHKVSTAIDYVNTLPNQDNIDLRQNYQRGIYASNYYPIFDKNCIISCQYSVLRASTMFSTKIRNITTNTLTQISVTTYSTTDKIFAIPYLDTSSYNEDYYKLEISINGTLELISDIFKIGNWSDKKDLVKINYFDKQNRYGGYFFKSTGVQFWNPIAYYTGTIEVSDPEDEPITYTNDPGDTVLLQSTPQRVSLLTLCDIHSSYIDVVKHQTCCSDFYVNDIKYVVSDFSTSKKEKSDIVDITMKLKMSDTDYFLKS